VDLDLWMRRLRLEAREGTVRELMGEGGEWVEEEREELGLGEAMGTLRVDDVGREVSVCVCVCERERERESGREKVILNIISLIRQSDITYLEIFDGDCDHS
jgi:hypothetical protein